MPILGAHTLIVNSDRGESRLVLQSGVTLHDALLDAGLPLRSSCGGKGSCGLCVVRLEESAAIPFTPAERSRLNADQLAHGLRLACQIEAGQSSSPDALHVALVDIPKSARWRTLRADEYGAFEMPVPLRAPRAAYGVAIDLGTTHIRLTLWDAANGRRLAGLMGSNPQGSYGVDVLSRLMEAVNSAATAAELRMLAAQAIGEGLSEMAKHAAIALADIGEVLVVGNTAMLTLLAGRNFELLMQPENWASPIACEPDREFLAGVWQLGVAASISFIQPLGGFIGSDLFAALIATRLTEQVSPVALIDFGTNSEMAVWDGRRLSATSTAGGPAFEGSGIGCGMPAEAGAIYRVQLKDERLAVSVLGDGPARGICGSGLVDAVAVLRQMGRLDRIGRFRQGTEDSLVLAEGEMRVALMRGDIDVLQRAKAAIGAGVAWLCARADVSPADLRCVYATGAFGHLLDIEHARQIGLLPNVEADRVRLEGNSALAGCELLLFSPDRDELLAAVRALVDVHNLAEDAAFETLFVENLYLQAMQA